MRLVRWHSVRLRLAVLVLGAAASALVPHAGLGTLAFATIGIALAVIAPAYLGALVLVVAEIVGWAVAYGLDASPPVLRTASFAIVLYLVHAATSLAASVPIEADVAPGVVRSWALRCVPGVAVAALAGAAVGLLGRPSGSLALDIVGMAAVVAVLAVLVWSSRTLDRRESS